ncbi:hypothetical protein [Micromonospora rubida]
MPELTRSAVSTLMVDGVRFPAAAYEGRTITLVAQLSGVSEDATATALQALARELDRPENILMYRPDTSEPVFFRTHRAGADRIVWDRTLKEVRVSIPAQPFACGLMETLSPITIPNNPATSGGCYFEVNNVKGSFETPLFVRLGADFMGGSGGQAHTLVMGVRRRGTPSAAPWVLQAESMTTGVATALAGATDAAMSGAGPNYARITPTNTDMDQRLTAVFPSTAGVDVRGRYRVLLRYRMNNLLDRWNVQFAYGPSGSPAVYNPAVSLPLDTNPRWVDLGTVQYPFGVDPASNGYSGVALATQGMRISLYAQRVSGTGTLDPDLLMYVPADDCYSAATIYRDSGVAAGIIDSAQTMVYAVGASGEIVPPYLPQPVVGGFPLVSPGVTNRIAFVADGGSIADSALTSSWTVTPYYWPQYGYVRPVGA